MNNLICIIQKDENWISEDSGIYFLSDTIFRLWLERLVGNPLQL